MEIFDFTQSNPPTAEEFQKIGQFLMDELNQVSELTFRETSSHVEPEKWLTLGVGSAMCHPFLLDLELSGTLSFSWIKEVPEISVILQVFSKGRRLTAGQDSLLTAKYLQQEQGSAWTPFQWEFDTWAEWQSSG